METRQFHPEIRETETGNKGFGHFLVFNRETELWKGFREKVDPGALDGVMDNDVRVLVNHDSNLIIARTKAGTAKLGKDEIGGTIEWEFPDTTAGRDLKENMRNGNIDGMSFGFTVKDDKLDRNQETGEVTRTIMKLERLYDASPVVFPAYPQTDAQVRELRTAIESREDFPKEEDTKPEVVADDDLAKKIEQEQKFLKLRINKQA